MQKLILLITISLFAVARASEPTQNNETAISPELIPKYHVFNSIAVIECKYNKTLGITTVEWSLKKNNTKIENNYKYSISEFSEIESKLSVRFLNPTDAGVYVCIGKNNATEIILEKTFLLDEGRLIGKKKFLQKV